MQMSYLCASDLPFKNFIYSRHLTSFGFVIVKNKLTVFYASSLILKINFAIHCQNLPAEPLACGVNFDNVMTQFIINQRTDA